MIEEFNKNSKAFIFKEKYIDKDGKSDIIERYKLEESIKYTSGDSPVFRSDSKFCEKYKLFRFKKTLNLNDKSKQWDLSTEEKEEIKKDHKKLLNKWPTMINNKKVSSTTVIYMKVYGRLECRKINNSIRPDIRKKIIKKSCVNCGTKTNIECDHKNSLKNDPRVMITKTQRLDDFQPLCGHCNKVKREAEIRAKRDNKRFSGKDLCYSVDFTEGDKTLDINDPKWYIGTYWGDCLEFKKKLTIK